MGNEGISVADALALRNSGNGSGNNGAFGGDGAWWVIILILFFAVGGWGRNGGGLGGNSDASGYSACCVPATAQGMTDAFNFNQLDNGIRSLANGLCDGFYAQNNAINGVVAAIQNCCCQTQQSIAELGYQVGQGFCGCKNNYKITVGDFVRENPRGIYLITMNGHITCAIDGHIYDTFDPSERLVWGAYRVI